MKYDPKGTCLAQITYSGKTAKYPYTNSHKIQWYLEPLQKKILFLLLTWDKALPFSMVKLSITVAIGKATPECPRSV